MLKRRSSWLGGAAALFLVLSLSGVALGVTPPDAEPVEPVVVDTTATFEDLDGNGIDDDCQEVAAVEDPTTAAAELLTVDTDADGVISTTEAAHSARIGGKNCNHGGYVSWIAQHKHDCVVEAPVAEPVVEPTVELIVTTPPDAEPDAEVEACETDEDAAITGAKKDKVAAAAARAASKAERTLARQAVKAERQAAKAERTVAREATKAERNAAKAARHAERQVAKAARTKKSH